MEDQNTPPNETAKWLARAITEGRTCFLDVAGLSVEQFPPDALRWMHKYITEYNEAHGVKAEQIEVYRDSIPWGTLLETLDGKNLQ